MRGAYGICIRTQLYLQCLPTAPGLPLQGNGDFGTSAFFGQLSDKLVLARIRSHGVRGAWRKAQWLVER
jgi:hypothetical protein